MSDCAQASPPGVLHENDVDDELLPRLTVACATKPQLEGTYEVLYAGRRRVNGMPVWATGTKRLYSYVEPDTAPHDAQDDHLPDSPAPLTSDPHQQGGRWVLAVGADAPFTGKKLLMAAQPHTGLLPSTCTEWMTWAASEEAWVVDRSVFVSVAHEHFTPPAAEAPSSQRGGAESPAQASGPDSLSSTLKSEKDGEGASGGERGTQKGGGKEDGGGTPGRRRSVKKDRPFSVITREVIGMHLDSNLKVTRVAKDGAADRAGLRVYDTVVYAVDPNTSKTTTLDFEKDLHVMAGYCKFLQVGYLRNRGAHKVTTIEIPWVPPPKGDAKPDSGKAVPRAKGWNDLSSHIPADDDTISKVRRRKLFNLLDAREEGLISLSDLLSGAPSEPAGGAGAGGATSEEPPMVPAERSPLLHTLRLKGVPESAVVSSFNVTLSCLRDRAEVKRAQKSRQERRVISPTDPTLDTTLSSEMDTLRSTIRDVRYIDTADTPPRGPGGASELPAVPSASLDLKGFRVFLEVLRRHLQLFNIFGANLQETRVRVGDFDRFVPLLISWGSAVLAARECSAFGVGDGRKASVTLLEIASWGVRQGLDLFVAKPGAQRADAKAKRSRSADTTSRRSRSGGRSPARSAARSASLSSTVDRTPRRSHSASTSSQPRRPLGGVSPQPQRRSASGSPASSPQRRSAPGGAVDLGNAWDVCLRSLPTGTSAVAKASRRSLYRSIETAVGMQGAGLTPADVVQGLLGHIGVLESGGGAGGNPARHARAGTVNSTAAATAIAASHRIAAAVCAEELDTNMPLDEDVVGRGLFRYILEALRMHFQLYSVIPPEAPPVGVADFRVVTPLLRSWGLEIPPNPLHSIRDASGGVDRVPMSTFSSWAVGLALRRFYEGGGNEASPSRSSHASPMRGCSIGASSSSRRPVGYDVA